MDCFQSIDPQSLSPQDCYKLIIGSIVPRPIAWVSSLSTQNVTNLAPFSFFNGVCSNPPTLLFCPMRRSSDGAEKDTLQNIRATGEFVVNIVTQATVEAMNQTAAECPPEVSEFEFAGLTPVSSTMVKPPGVQESPIRMECTLNQIIEVGDGSVGSGCVVLGTIVYFHLRQDVYDPEQHRILTDVLAPVGRMAGSQYCRIEQGNTFSLSRP